MKRLLVAVLVLLGPAITSTVPASAEPDHIIVCTLGATTPVVNTIVQVAVVQGVATMDCAPPPPPESSWLLACLAWNPNTATPGDIMWLRLEGSCHQDQQTAVQPRASLRAFPSIPCRLSGFYAVVFRGASIHNNETHIDDWLMGPPSGYINCPGVPIRP